MTLLLILLLVAAIAAILILALRKPDVFRVERRAVLRASPEAIFAQINSLGAWEAWSPWAKKDPNAKNTLSGPAEGVGSVFEWDGNNQVGKGRMEIIGSDPFRRITIRLNFLKPMECENRAVFTLTPREGGTEVHWMMDGPNLFMGKVMQVFMDMDRMVGRDFEAGLDALRQRVET